jgi:alginate O-acetyltransferase complex protein AlgI
VARRELDVRHLGRVTRLFLVINHWWIALSRQWVGASKIRIPGTVWLARALTFTCVALAWVFFRAESVGGASAVFRGLSGANGFVLPEQIIALLPSLGAVFSSTGNLALLGGGTVMGVFEQGALIGIAFAIAMFGKNTQSLSQRARLWIVLATFGFVVQAVFFGRTPSEFLYFQF